eukprot:1148129-Pelagomonas_calceolata.AAC.1
MLDQITAQNLPPEEDFGSQQCHASSVHKLSASGHEPHLKCWGTILAASLSQSDSRKRMKAKLMQVVKAKRKGKKVRALDQ